MALTEKACEPTGLVLKFPSVGTGPLQLASPEVASAVVQAALQRGLLLLKAGVTGNAIRVLVPLVIGDAELDEALAAWEQALDSTL